MRINWAAAPTSQRHKMVAITERGVLDVTTNAHDDAFKKDATPKALSSPAHNRHGFHLGNLAD